VRREGNDRRLIRDTFESEQLEDARKIGPEHQRRRLLLVACDPAEKGAKRFRGIEIFLEQRVGRRTKLPAQPPDYGLHRTDVLLDADMDDGHAAAWPFNVKRKRDC
jgi:hypothetical protein